ncbi:hypothetical protein CSKR_203770 [Clonorchis sinensis]|uniref:Uncharacterized protein n=1 Tax=Clonorchis sinensis TaxID=79923 RepID=A0A8T1N1H6_CLOSI|nr:hypothetical protein CSKR_203770 [Clonorchis sinensis]
MWDDITPGRPDVYSRTIKILGEGRGAELAVKRLLEYSDSSGTNCRRMVYYSAMHTVARRVTGSMLLAMVKLDSHLTATSSLGTQTYMSGDSEKKGKVTLVCEA